MLRVCAMESWGGVGKSDVTRSCDARHAGKPFSTPAHAAASPDDAPAVSVIATISLSLRPSRYLLARQALKLTPNPGSRSEATSQGKKGSRYVEIAVFSVGSVECSRHQKISLQPEPGVSDLGTKENNYLKIYNNFCKMCISRTAGKKNEGRDPKRVRSTRAPRSRTANHNHLSPLLVVVL